MKKPTPLDYRFHLGDKSWELDFQAITVDESLELTKITGNRWMQLLSGFDQREPIAVKAFLWLARKKAGEDIEFHSEAMNFVWGEFDAEGPLYGSDDDSEVGEQSDNAGEGADPTKATSKTSRKR